MFAPSDHFKFCALLLILVPAYISAQSNTCNLVIDSFFQAKTALALRHSYEDVLYKSGFHLKENDPGYEFFVTNPLRGAEYEMFVKSDLLLKTAQIAREKLFSNGSWANQTPQELRAWLYEISDYLQDYKSEILFNERPLQSSLNDRYRSYDGTCNNLYQPKLGSAFTPFSRLASEHYHDGIHTVRVGAISNAPLPTPRYLGNMPIGVVHIEKCYPNMLSIMFGQLIAHDTGLRVDVQKAEGGAGIQCCSANYQKFLPEKLTHSACLPLAIPVDDPLATIYNFHAMNFIRSQTLTKNDGILRAAQQANSVTNHLDLSTIYGSSQLTAQAVRLFNGGLLRTNKNNILAELPNCPNNACYWTGDVRVNQTPMLVILHSMFQRLHNQLAYRLQSINSHWDDEKLFQEARRITIAIYQNIIYEEWLPIFLGHEYCKRHGINSDGDCYHRTYDPTLDGSTTNEFSTSAFRHFHAYVVNEVELRDKYGRVTEKILLSDTMLNTKMLEEKYLEVLQGMILQKMYTKGYNTELKNYMFKKKNGNGLDMLSMDIQRCRDHGIAPYYAYRKLCRLPEVKSFDDLGSEIPKESVDQLRLMYETIYDVDLHVGAALEQPTEGLLGTTFQCMIGEQFFRYRHGDRFFYTNCDQPYPFNAEQLNEIRKYTMAQLLSEISELAYVNSNAFLADCGETLVCEAMPQFNIELWRDHAASYRYTN